MTRRLEPTHTCFDDALGYINKRILSDPAVLDDTALVLVHGIATGTNGGEPYAHAWCEEDGLCWDSALWDGQLVYYGVVPAEFYQSRQIQETTIYTAREACRLNLKTNHYGPWEPKYLALCADGDRRVLGAHRIRPVAWISTGEDR